MNESEGDSEEGKGTPNRKLGVSGQALAMSITPAIKTVNCNNLAGSVGVRGNVAVKHLKINSEISYPDDAHSAELVHQRYFSPLVKRCEELKL